MNYRMLFKTIGTALLIETAFLIVPLIIAAVNNEPTFNGILLSIIICGVLGLCGFFIRNKQSIRARDSIVAVCLSWVAISICGAFPFYLSNTIPNFMNCVFESVSGFTTTGATIVSDVGLLPLSLLMWRALMHWIGGMGVIVFLMVLSSNKGKTSVHMLSVESTGPEKSKLTSSPAKTAKTLYLIYATLTAASIIALIIAGMPVFDAFVHGFSIAGTGGFSMTNASIAAYNSTAIEIIAIVFMLLFGTSFTLHYQIIKGKIKNVFKCTEFKIYLITIGIGIVIIAFNIASAYNYNYGDAFLDAAFQASSVASTTGLATADFNTWPMLSKTILLLLMIIGGMAGSTGGGVKYARITIAFKSLGRGLKKLLHPNLVSTIRMDNKPVAEPTVSLVKIFLISYFALFCIATIIVSLDNLDFATTTTSVLSSLSNVGPGLSLIGPTGNYAMFSNLSKATLSVCMIAGRLEIFPFLLLFAPRTWKE